MSATNEAEQHALGRSCSSQAFCMVYISICASRRSLKLSSSCCFLACVRVRKGGDGLSATATKANKQPKKKRTNSNKQKQLKRCHAGKCCVSIATEKAVLGSGRAHDANTTTDTRVVKECHRVKD